MCVGIVEGKVFALLGCCVVLVAALLPTFLGNVSVPSSRLAVVLLKNEISWYDTSITVYEPTRRNISGDLNLKFISFQSLFNNTF